MSSQTQRTWTATQIGLLTLLYPDKKTATIATLIGKSITQIYAKASSMGIKKSAAYLASPAAGRTSGQQGIGTRFTKGHTSWNKGQQFVAGGKSAQTQFKKGQMPHNWHPIGHERLTQDGYTERKMTDTGITRKDYIAIHRLVWVSHHGEVPAGHAIVFKDGNKQNTDISNLECISRSALMKRNSYHNYGKEIAQLVQLKGAITRQINKRERTQA